jgi:preprotein translocase subunit SecA
MYVTVDRFVKTLKLDEDFTIDEKLKAINLTGKASLSRSGILKSRTLRT